MRARGGHRRGAAGGQTGRGAGAARRQHAAARLRRAGAAASRLGVVVRARHGVHAGRVRRHRGRSPGVVSPVHDRRALPARRSAAGGRARPRRDRRRSRTPNARATKHAIAVAGGLDLCLLGIGGNGHIAFNEPGSSFDSRTRVVALADDSRAAVAGAFGGEAVPTRALTMGIATILAARRCVLLAYGAGEGRRDRARDRGSADARAAGVRAAASPGRDDHPRRRGRVRLASRLAPLSAGAAAATARSRRRLDLVSPRSARSRPSRARASTDFGAPACGRRRLQPAVRRTRG